MRERSKGVLIYLSDRERNQLEKQAGNAELSMSQLVRKLIMGTDIQPRPPDNIAQLIREINYIGNNINQIAKKVNIESRVSQAQLEEIFHLLGEIYREVKR